MPAGHRRRGLAGMVHCVSRMVADAMAFCASIAVQGVSVYVLSAAAGVASYGDSVRKPVQLGGVVV